MLTLIPDDTGIRFMTKPLLMEDTGDYCRAAALLATARMPSVNAAASICSFLHATIILMVGGSIPAKSPSLVLRGGMAGVELAIRTTTKYFLPCSWCLHWRHERDPHVRGMYARDHRWWCFCLLRGATISAMYELVEWRAALMARERPSRHQATKGTRNLDISGKYYALTTVMSSFSLPPVITVLWLITG